MRGHVVLNVKVGHHFAKVGERVVVGIGVDVGKVLARVGLGEARVVAAEGERAGQEFRHHRVVRYQGGQCRELLGEALWTE